MPKRFFPLLGFSAFCCATVFVQIASVFLLQYTFPQIGSVESILLAALFGGMAAGEILVIHQSTGRVISLLLGFTFLVFSFFFSPLVLFALTHASGKAALLLFLVFSMFRLGQMMVSAVYSTGPVASSYARINFVLMLLAPAAVLILWRWGVTALMGATGISFFLAEFANIAPAQPNLFRASYKVDLVSVFQGLAASLYVGTAFRVFYLILWPLGLEFPIYLVTAFGCMAVSTYLVKAGKFRLSSAAAIVIGAGIFFLELFLLSREALKGAQLLSFATYVSLVPAGLRYLAYPLLEFMQILILLLPYFFFGSVFSLRDKEAPGSNHLFSLALGNATAFFIVSTLLVNLSIFYLCSLLAGLVLVANSCTREKKALLAAGGLAAFWLFATPPDLDLRLVRQVKTLTPKLGAFDRLDATRWESIEKLFYRDGGVGYVMDDGGERKSLGMGGYATSINNLYDELTGHVAAGYVQPGDAVLILGLGNRTVLNILADKLKGTTVEVIDNFGPFQDREFLTKINPFIPDNFHLIYDDIFPFLGRNRKKYDLIVTNLTFPTYASARKLYTIEFGALVKRALKPSGVFVSEGIDDPYYRCRLMREFPDIKGVPQDTSRPRAVFVASANPPGLPLARGNSPWPDCTSVELPTLGRPFIWDRYMLLSGVNYGRIFSPPPAEPITEHFPAFGNALSLANSQSGTPFFLAADPGEKKDIFIVAAKKMIEAQSQAYALQPPAWLTPVNRRREAVVIMQRVPATRLVTDEPAEALPDLPQNGIAGKRVWSLHSAPEKGIYSVLGLRNAGAALFPKEEITSHSELEISFDKGFPQDLKELFREEIQRLPFTGAGRWRVEITRSCRDWPRTKPGENYLRVLVAAQAHPAPPRAENQFLLPLLDPVTCSGKDAPQKLPEIALGSAFLTEDPAGPLPGEILFWRGGSGSGTGRIGSKYRFRCR